jgi:uncharacterized protein YggE
MNRSRSISNVWLACLLLPCFSACAPQGHVLAQSAVPPGISVSGHGEARGKPDIARVTIGVETRARVASEQAALWRRRRTFPKASMASAIKYW